MTLFEAAKSVEALDFAREHLGIEFNRSRKARSPFREERTPSFSYHNGVFTDFGGSFKGDLIALVGELKNLTPVEAAKFICANARIEYEEHAPTRERKKETRSLNEIFREQSDYLARNIFELSPHIQKVFTNYAKIFMHDSLSRKIGWDKQEGTLTIANIFEGNVVNIKWRTKRGHNGKWIGASAAQGAQTLPMVHNPKGEKYLVLVEGEKDLLNLASLGIACATMGGVSNSYERHLKIFEGIEVVYIWFDYDLAGVSNVLPRASEAYSAGAKRVVWIDFERLVPRSELFEKFDVSDYLARYPLSEPEEFFGLARRFELIPKRKRHERDLQLELGILRETIARPHRAKANARLDVAGLNNRLIEMECMNARLLQWAEKKSSEINEALSGSLEPKAVAKLADYANEIKFFGSEKRAQLAKHIHQEAERLGIVLRKDDVNLFFYNGSFFQKWEREDFFNLYSRHLEERVQKLNTSAQQNDLYEMLRRYAEPFPPASDKTLINLKNCVLDVSARKIRRHDPLFGFRYGLDFEFDKEATCPLFDKFLDTSLPSKEVQACVLEYIGYCLMPTHRFQKFLLLTGRDANGKSVLMEIMRAFFSPESVGAVENFDGFNMEGLLGKQVNFSDDRNLKSLRSTEIDSIKKIVAGSPFNIDLKFKGGGALLENPPKLIIATNALPSTTDFAFRRRMLLIPFEQTFDEKNRDDFLAKKIIEHELPGVFNRVLRAMSDLNARGMFSKPEAVNAAILELELDGNSVYRFAEDRLEKDENASVSTQRVYEEYMEYCKAEGVAQKSKNNFSKDLRERMGVEIISKRVSSVVVKFYRGVKVKVKIELEESEE